MKIRKALKTKGDYEVYYELDAKTSYIDLGKKDPPKFLQILCMNYKEYCEMLDENSNAHWILEDEEENPIGYAQIEINGEKMKIKDFFILRKKRRCGYGTGFFSLLEKKAKQEGVSIIEIVILSEGARCFWVKLGFKKDFIKYFIKEI